MAAFQESAFEARAFEDQLVGDAYQESAFQQQAFQGLTNHFAFQPGAFQISAFEGVPQGFQESAFQFNGFQVADWPSIRLRAAGAIGSGEAFGQADRVRRVLTPPSSPPTTLNSVSFPTGFTPNGDPASDIQALVLVNGVLFACAQTGGIIRWANPSTDLNTVTSVTVPSFNGSTLQPVFMVYDSTLGKLLVSCSDVSGVGSDLIILTVDPTTLVCTILVDDSTVTAPTPSPICSDGTYVYAQAAVSGKINIRKYKLADGTLAGNWSPFPTNYRAGQTMFYDAATTRVYFAARLGNASQNWAGYVTSDLSTAFAFIDTPPYGTNIDEESTLLGGYYWFTAEASGVSKVLVRVNADMSAFALIDTGVTDHAFGAKDDGTNVIVTMGSNPKPTYMLWIDPATSIVLWSLTFATSSSGDNVNSSVYDAAHGLYYAAVFSSDSIIYSVNASAWKTEGDSWGRPHVARVLSPLGGVSTEAFGTPTVVSFSGFTVSPQGIPSSETFGVTHVEFVVAAQGAASTETFGTTRLPRLLQRNGAIPSTEAFGLTHVLFVVEPIGVSSSEAFGTTRVLSPQYISIAGRIASAEAFGTTHVQFVVRTIGIASSEAFGQADKIRFVVAATGIASAQTFGVANVRFLVYPLGITSREAFGVTTLSTAYNIFSAGAIPSAETFGLTHVLFVVRGIGVASAQAFGTTSLPRLLQRGGAVASSETFGVTHVRFVVGTLGIVTREAFGTPTKSPQVIFVHPGIGSSEAFGQPTLFDATVKAASAYGAVFLSDTAVFAITILDGVVYNARTDSSKVYGQTIDEAIVYDERTSTSNVYAGTVDDTPGG